MMLREVIEGIEAKEISGDLDRGISGISYDSRKVLRDHLFVAVRGEHVDGHDFIHDAVRRGAGAVLQEHAAAAPLQAGVGRSVTVITVHDSRGALALVSNNFYRRPSRQLVTIGVTGTNGKTTTTYIIKSILEAWGKRVGLIGTIQYIINDKVYEAVHTTPEALELQEFMSRMYQAGCRYAVSEVSSHALAQKRVDGTEFRVAVFTNLTRDHLDYHKTMEDYFFAKERLFTELMQEEGVAVINHDDPFGRRLIADLKARSGEKRSVISYGLEPGADLAATDITNAFSGLQFTVVMNDDRHRIASPLMGIPNVYNILAAAAAARALGVPWETILRGIENTGTVRGRFEKIGLGQGFLAVLDYAHTEDALERLIHTARSLTRGRIITVFGCGGDRDRGKRPRMGAIATRLSDQVIITSDNPRSEDPGAIIREVAAGAEQKNFLVVPDRKEAIHKAVAMAAKDDVVLIAGKGHETYQEMGGRLYPFSDREVLEEAIRQVAGNA